jgi:hypothetical protein
MCLRICEHQPERPETTEENIQCQIAIAKSAPRKKKGLCVERRGELRHVAFDILLPETQDSLNCGVSELHCLRGIQEDVR